MSSSNCSFLTCIQVLQKAGKVVWYSHLFKNFPKFVMIHIVKVRCIVNEVEVDVFLEFSCIFYDTTDIGNLISGSSAFSKSSLYILKFIHILSGLSFPSPGDLPHPGIQPASPALQADDLWSEPPEKPLRRQKPLRKAEEPEIKLPTSAGSLKKQENSRKNLLLFHWLHKSLWLCCSRKALTVWITTNCEKFLKRWEYQTTLPASWEICMQVKKQQLESDMEQWTGSNLGKWLHHGCILSPSLLNWYAH